VSPPFGIIGVFTTPDALKDAARQLRSLGFRAVEAHTPYPIDGLDQLLRPARRQLALPLIMFAGAVLGGAWGYFIQYWDEALDYPINVGGRPHNSWPAFIVGTVEFMLLVAVAAGLFALLASCRLPRLYHPLFNAVEFDRASIDRFVLCVEARDPSFEVDHLRRIFERFGAEQVAEVPAA
jgi:ActD protein